MVSLLSSWREEAAPDAAVTLRNALTCALSSSQPTGASLSGGEAQHPAPRHAYHPQKISATNDLGKSAGAIESGVVENLSFRHMLGRNKGAFY